MANLSKERRERMISKLEELKQQHNDDASIAALNEIENALREKKYGLVWEEHSEAVDDMLKDNIPILIEDPERRLCKDESLPWNFIIEGDNLQALYLLEKTHRGRVDCIYIDPPYNTGARDWKYNNDYVDGNDEYRHSKWLSMMKSRLAIARRLLNPKSSVLIVTIDEKEYLHLGCLLEEMFPEAHIQMISSIINPYGAIRFNEFTRTNEFIYYVMQGDYSIGALDETEYAIEGEQVPWFTFRRSNARHTRPRQFYPIYVNNETLRIQSIGDPITPDIDRFTVPQIEGCTAVFPVMDNGAEMMWGLTPEICSQRVAEGYVKVGKYTPNAPQQYIIQYLRSGTIDDINEGKIAIVGHNPDGSIIAENKETKKMLPRTQWNFKTHNARDYGSKIVKSILGSGRFDFPKSLYAVHDTIRYLMHSTHDATIVDFFAGSGTTMHAVNLLNAEDGGHRKCIMVTNNEISEDEQKSFEDRGIHKGDKEWEERGIAKYVTWPRTVCAIKGVNINGEPLKGTYIGSEIPMSDGFQANVKYLKCEWTPRKPDDYLLSNALCLHVKELIELQTAQEIDGVKNVIILSNSDYKRIFGNPDLQAAVDRVWVNENLIFNAEEMRNLKSKRLKYIPREYFSQELKEVGEYV